MSIRQSFSCVTQFLMASSLLLLSACGGGGGGGGGGSTSFTLTGIAATGAPVPVGTVVTAKCATGTGTVTMDATTGTFTLTVTGGVAPCLLQAVTPSVPGPSQTMYAVALAAGVVNITPLTHAVADRAAGDIASAYTNWGGTFDPASLTAANLAAGQTALLTYLTKAGFSVAGVGDFLTESFPANSVHVHDKLLDEIKATNMQLSMLSAQAKALVRLPDTGQTECADANGTTTPCAGTGQDGELGLDASAATNSALDGVAGFSYLKLSSAGKPVTASATSWDCVHDNITGLQWENKIDATNTSHLRSSNHSYTWYSTDTANNGNSAGSTGSNTCSATLTSNLCNTQAYVTAVNAAALCGKTDWRLPTSEELHSIVNYGASEPSIDSNYFPNTQTGSYWSSLSTAGYPSYAWYVFFFGHTFGSADDKVNGNYVRLVRSSQ